MTARANTKKPPKPYPDFPLTAHARGQWVKKIRGKQHTFGPWDDWKGALERYLEQRDYLQAGIPLPACGVPGVLTLRDLVNLFLNGKKHHVENGELRQRTFDDYLSTGKLLVEFLSRERLVSELSPSDFDQLRVKLSMGRGPYSLGNNIQRARTILNYAYEAELIDRPVRFGPNFKRPPQRVYRAHRQSQGERMFSPDEFACLLGSANTAMHAFILLGINCGFGNTDIASAPSEAFEQDDGWVDFPRTKTSIPRRCPLWPETLEAVQAAMVESPEAGDPNSRALAFRTKSGVQYRTDNISTMFRRLATKAGCYRKHDTFYSLRRTFETIAGDARDQIAVDAIMGHAGHTMAGVYRQRIEDDRLVAVSEHVRKWLFGKG